MRNGQVGSRMDRDTMRVPMKNRIIAFAFAMAALGGCSQRDKVPGTVTSGPIEEVDARSSASGNGIDATASLLQEVGVVPLADTVRPTIPVIKPPQIITFWVYPRKSKDGLAFREGFYIHAVTRPFSWGIDDAMREDRVTLGGMLNMRVDGHGRVVVDKTKDIHPAPEDVNRMRSMAKQMPWREGADTTAQTRATIVYDNGQAVTLPPRTGEQPAYVGPGNTVNMAEVERALKEADARVREVQSRPATPAQQALPQGSSGSSRLQGK